MLRSRVGAYVLGVLTVWPIGYLLFFLGLVAVLLTRGLRDLAPGTDGALPTGIVVLFSAHVVTILLMLGLLVVYLVLPLRDERLRREPDRRLLWVLLNVLVGPLAWPAFWWVFVRPGSEESRLRAGDPVR